MCQCSHWLGWQDVPVLVDYADTCPRSCWLRWQRSCWPSWHGVSVVNDNTDTSVSIVNHYLDTSFLQISLRKRKGSWNWFCLFICCPERIFYLKKKLSNFFWHCPFKRFNLGPIWKYKIARSWKMECPRSRQLHRQAVFSLYTNIFLFLDYC